MHATEPGDYFTWWNGLEDEPLTWRDSEDYWESLYELPELKAYSGNSGGPLYAQTDLGNWAANAVLVGGDEDGSNALVRGIDAQAWALIRSAMEIVATNNNESPRMWRVEDLAASEVSTNAITLMWTDGSARESGYRVLRNEQGVWTLLATTAADAQQFTDSTVQPGRTYAYRVQAVDALGNFAPRSNEVRVETPGSDQQLAAAINARGLNLRSMGSASWFIDGERIRAGKVHALNASTDELELIGPGVLFFDWAVSSEVNPDSGGDTKDIYDALFINVNNEPYFVGDQQQFLSGILPRRTGAITVASGQQRIAWTYTKDPYTSEGEDTGFLYNLTWAPDPTNGYPVWGGYAIDGNTHASAWLGSYDASALPWIYHPKLGWLYIRTLEGDAMVLHSPLPGIGTAYASAAAFPYLYSYSRQRWLYYYPDSGIDGRGVWLYDFTEGRRVAADLR
jgi:hypothetical protein